MIPFFYHLSISALAHVLTISKPFRAICAILNLDQDTLTPLFENQELTKFQFVIQQIHFMLAQLFSCSICMSFWISLYCHSGDILKASLTCLLTIFLEKLISILPVSHGQDL